MHLQCTHSSLQLCNLYTVNRMEHSSALVIDTDELIPPQCCCSQTSGGRQTVVREI